MYTPPLVEQRLYLRCGILRTVGPHRALPPSSSDGGSSTPGEASCCMHLTPTLLPSPTPSSTQLPDLECHSQKIATVPSPSSRTLTQIFCLRKKARIHATKALPKRLDFIPKRAWISLTPRAFSRKWKLR